MCGISYKNHSIFVFPSSFRRRDLVYLSRPVGITPNLGPNYLALLVELLLGGNDCGAHFSLLFFTHMALIAEDS
jgi:hypothetical protein